jgi:hypothetical protein
VLLEATKCIFAPSVTGYTAPEDDMTPAKLIEMIKGSAKSGG